MAQSANDRDKNRDRAEGHTSGDFGKRLASLEERLGAAKQRHPERAETERRGNAMGIAFRIATELVAGVLVGALIGWQLDEWLGTKPILLLVFFVLGAAAGILNVMRTAREMQSGSGPEGE
jgi:ATP synthase protein I